LNITSVVGITPAHTVIEPLAKTIPQARILKNMHKLLQTLRLKHGCCQGRLAELIGVSRPTFAKIESGEVELTISQARQLVELFHLSLSDFLAGRESVMPQLVVQREKPTTPLKAIVAGGVEQARKGWHRLNRQRRQRSNASVDVNYGGAESSGSASANVLDGNDCNNPILAKSVAAHCIHVRHNNIRKFKEVVLYVLEQVGAKPNVGESMLAKLLYFIDFDYYEKYGIPLTGISYIKYSCGPVPACFATLLREMCDANEMIVAAEKQFQLQYKKYLPLRVADLARLSARELCHIDWVLGRLADRTLNEIGDYARRDVPWAASSDLQPIDYQLVAQRTAEFSVR
jgi:DNA-binding XRE family transcriptional regulator